VIVKIAGIFAFWCRCCPARSYVFCRLLLRPVLRISDRLGKVLFPHLQVVPLGEERRLLAGKASGIDPQALQQISVLDPERHAPAEPQPDLTEIR